MNKRITKLRSMLRLMCKNSYFIVFMNKIFINVYKMLEYFFIVILTKSKYSHMNF